MSRVDRVLGENIVIEVCCTVCASDLGTNTLSPIEKDYSKRQRRIAREHVAETGHSVTLFTERAEYLSRME